MADQSILIGTGHGVDDWAVLSTEPGLLAAEPFETTPGILAHADDGNPYGWALDTSIKPPGRAGSARVAVLNSYGEGNGNLFLNAGQTFREGETFWHSYRFWLPPEFVHQMYPTSSGRRGFKLSIFDRSDGTNNVHENVIQSQSDGIVFGYHQDGTTYVTWQAPRSTAHSGTRDVYQSAIDNGLNPLTGVNPDNGTAWTGLQQDNAQLGTLADADTIANGYAPGLGNPNPFGGRRWPVSEWGWLLNRTVIGKWGVNNSRSTWWLASESSPTPVMLIDEIVTFANAGGVNQLWMTLFFTDRIAGGMRVGSRTNAIPGITPRTIGLGGPVGAWLIGWNASTKQATATPPSGGTIGAPRGVSAEKKFANLFDSTNNNGYNNGRYIGIEVTDFASLPATDQVETLNVVSGRNDTFGCFAQARIGTGIQRAPGLLAPSGLGTLATIAASLAAWQWSSPIPMTGFTSSLIASASDSIFSYGRKAFFNPITRKFVHDGKSHGSEPYLSRTIEAGLDLVWSAAATPGMNPTAGQGHSGGDVTMDPATGDMYGRQYGPTRTTMIRPGGVGAWTTAGIADIPGGLPVQDQTALEWFAGLFTQGGLVYANEGGISLYNKATDAWSAAPGGPSYPNVMGSHDNWSVYCRRKDCVFTGGGVYEGTGDAGGPTKNWRVGANGTPVRRADTPFNCSHSGGNGMVIPNGNLFGWPLVIHPNNGTIREFDDDANTYSAPLTTMPAALANAWAAPNGAGIFPIPELNGILFTYLTDSTTPSTDALFLRCA